MRYGSMFTGGGLADIGARLAGLTPVWGIEYDPAIAAVAQQNDPTGTIHTASVLDADYSTLPRVDVLHASPPCPNFSAAKTGAVETPLDMALADAVCRAIDAQRPQLFTLENVRAYVGSKSLARIQATLLDLDYHVTTVIVNAADYGVPQTRVRLFLLAHAGGWMQSQRPLPAKQPWRGWYQAIEDLIPSLPASQFAPWQLARLPDEIRETVLMMSGVSGFDRLEVGQGVRYTSQPAATCTAEPTGGMPRAFILSSTEQRSETTCFEREPLFTLKAQDRMPRAFIADGQANDRGESITIRHADEPFYTTSASMERRPARAFLVNEDSKSGIRHHDEPGFVVVAERFTDRMAWISAGRVVAMTPRALARFQSVPDSYVLPDKKALACKIIGNGVAVEAYAAILRSQL